MSARPRSNQAGFTLLEVIVAMAISLAILGGTAKIMTSAMNSTEAAKDVLDMNSHLRAAMDLLQRDLLQTGQGLPVGRRIGVPNGAGATPIQRPGPESSDACDGVSPFPDQPSLPAVNVGAGLGPMVNGQCTDVITILAADNLFGQVSLASIASGGTSAIIHNSVNISDNPDANLDNLRAGDLLMLVKGATSVLMHVTAVSGQQVTFGTGDPLGLNQFDTGLTVLGTINQLKAQAPADPNAPVVVGGVQQRTSTQATRIRMVSYYVDATTEPLVPRLVRQIGGGPANAVAIGVQAFRLSYDIANQDDNPTSVRMNQGDLDGTGACSPDPCSENQIRKANILLSMTASDPRTRGPVSHGRQSQNALYAQVSFRSLAFVDRYR